MLSFIILLFAFLLMLGVADTEEYIRKDSGRPRVDYYDEDKEEGLSDGALLGIMTAARLSGDKFTESYAAWQWWQKRR